MAIASVKKIHLFTFPQHQKTLLEILQRAGCIQIDSAETLLPEEERSYFKESVASDEEQKIASLEQRLAKLEDLIETLEKREKHPTLIAHFAKPKELTSFPDFEKLAVYDETPLLQQAQQLQDSEHEIQKEIRQHGSVLRQLRLIGDWPIPLESLRDTARTFVFLAVMPQHDANSLLAQLAAVIGEESHVEIVNRVHHQDVVLLIARREKKKDFLRWIENQPLELLAFDGLRGSAAENITRLQSEIEKLTNRLNEAAEKYLDFIPHLPQLRRVYDYWNCESERLKKFHLLRQSPHTVMLSGWIPAEDIPTLSRQLEKEAVEVAFATADPEPDETPPAAYQNPPLAKPFEFVTDLYSRPRYWEIDPTPFIGAFFALFFGICLTDAGYGILITLIALWAIKKLAPLSPNSAKLLKIIFYGGIATTIVGFLTGGIFGMAFEDLPGSLGKLQHLVLLNPLQDQMKFLAFTLGLGVLHVSFGIILKFRWQLKHGQAKDAWLDRAPWLAIILAVVMLIMASQVDAQWLNSFGYILLSAAALVILLFGGRASKNPFARLANGLFSLYQVSGLLGDVLSYARLFALGVATGVIAGVVNFLAELALGIPYVGFVLMPLILILGHSMNIAINALGGFIHTTRLQFVEFFGKFYEGGGEPFEPFHLKLKYTRIKEQEQ